MPPRLSLNIRREARRVNAGPPGLRVVFNSDAIAQRKFSHGSAHKRYPANDRWAIMNGEAKVDIGSVPNTKNNEI